MNHPLHSQRWHFALLPAALSIAMCMAAPTFAQSMQRAYDQAPQQHSNTHGSRPCPYGKACIDATPAQHQANATYPGAPSAPQRYQYGGINPAVGRHYATQQHGNTGYGTSTSAYGSAGYRAPAAPSATNLHGGKTTFGAAPIITGANGKTIDTGQGQTIHGLHGQTINTATGVSHSAQSINGVNSHGDHQGSIHQNNGGTQGDSESLGEFWHSHTGYGGDKGEKDGNGLEWRNGSKWQGTDTDGLSWNRGKPWNGPDGDGGFYTHGHHVTGATNGEGVGDDPDLGPQGSGTLVSGTGKRKHPGHRQGTDAGDGRGQDDGGTTGSGSMKSNATGAYHTGAHYGQDASARPPAPDAPINASKLQNGAIDPKRGSGPGGG